MNKPLFSALYLLSILTAGLTIHQAFAQRSPAVETITEVSIEENRPAVKPAQSENGFDFKTKDSVTQNALSSRRVPANITTKSTEKSTPYTFIGPMIFLIALPIALWIVIYKKMNNSYTAEKVEYYPKNFQFKPYKTDYQEQDVDDEEHNLPKAS